MTIYLNPGSNDRGIIAKEVIKITYEQNRHRCKEQKIICAITYLLLKLKKSYKLPQRFISAFINNMKNAALFLKMYMCLLTR